MEIQVIEAEELNTLPELKRNEIGAVSNNIMSSISVWKTKLSEVVIADATDTESMKLADKIRLDVKKERCSQEKVIDDMRDDVKMRMIEQKTEDEVLLAIRKAIVAQYKEIETMAEYMATTAKRHEEEQKQITGELRLEKVKKYTENVTILDVLNLADEMFEIVLAGYEKTYNDKQEAEDAKRRNDEEDAKAKEALELKARIIEFAKLLSENGFAKSEDAKQFNKGTHFISVEKLYIYTREQLLERFSEIDQIIETNKKAIETANQMAEQSRILEEKEAKEKAERDAKEAEIARLEKAPILEKLNVWIEKVVIASPPIETETTAEIMARFEGFKKWAKDLINKQ